MENDLSRIHFENIRGIHIGKRGFVVGNGPSLKLQDLNRISNEIAIGSNKVFLAFDRTPWRPNYYVITSPLQSKLYGSVFHQHFKTIYTRKDLEDLIEKGESDVFSWNPLNSTWDYPPEDKHFSFDLCVGTYSGFSVTYESLQLAVHLGLNPIYLIGCDHHYQDQPATPQHNSNLVSGPCKDHFIPNYRKPGETFNPYMKETVTNSFKHAQLACMEKGIQIMNATRGGALEVFERVEFESLF